MQLIFAPYKEQVSQWPKTGRHIMAQFDTESIVVYQAYRPSIGQYAVQHGILGGPEFGLSRMSWIKPNFLWMMYRCGWGTKENQETVLALWLRREAFDSILRQAVHSTYVPGIYADESAWKQTVGQSNVRLQWDPDHDPSGSPLERRAIQLGLRGDVLRQFAQGGWVTHIEDITRFVREQHTNAQGNYENLLVPRETVYPVEDAAVKQRLQISSF